VLTGHCGPNAFRALTAAGVNVIVGVQGSVSEAIERFKSGDLRTAGGPDVGGHGKA
jgi:predicted Fe-Mo cluster-binding NifX family protein